MIVLLGIIFIITLFSLVVGLVNQNSLPLPTASGAIIVFYSNLMEFVIILKVNKTLELEENNHG